MSDDISFDRAFDDAPGAAASVSPLVRRILAPNPGPFTFRGTCTYIVGRGRVAVIDPGPEDAAHLAAILAAVRDESVSHIVVTHTHRDHSPGARALREATGARIVGCGPHRPARDLALGEINPLDSSGDALHAPDEAMRAGDAVTGPGWSLMAVETPGHTANHLCFALPEERSLFSGDHVMAWSTTIVAPPDGAMADYMASLEHLRARDDALFWPGHGGPVREPARFMRALHHHRRQREGAILRAVSEGCESVPAIVERVYEGLAPALKGAAGLSTLAHLEDLVTRGAVEADGPASLTARYRAARMS